MGRGVIDLPLGLDGRCVLVMHACQLHVCLLDLCSMFLKNCIMFIMIVVRFMGNLTIDFVECYCMLGYNFEYFDYMYQYCSLIMRIDHLCSAT